MKKFLLLSLVIVFCFLPLIAIAVHADDSGAYITFMNKTSSCLTFYVDGVTPGVCLAGESQAVYASLGRHTIKVVNQDNLSLEIVIDLGFNIFWRILQCTTFERYALFSGNGLFFYY